MDLTEGERVEDNAGTFGVSDADLVAITEGAELCRLSVPRCWPAKKHVSVSFILEIIVA